MPAIGRDHAAICLGGGVHDREDRRALVIAALTNARHCTSKTEFQISISLDGFVAGPNPSEENRSARAASSCTSGSFELAAWREPHGREGGEVNASTPVIEESLANVGATSWAATCSAAAPGPWGEDPVEGWWGEDPPFHTPVFVLTHHAREPLAMEGGTTFTFVTDGIESALAQAREAAGGKDVSLGGGADVAQQYLAAGLIDELR